MANSADDRADTVDDWLTPVRQHEASVRLLAVNRSTGTRAYFHAGLAVECALKAYIMHTTGMNRWPASAERPDLYVHRIDRLAKIAGLIPSPRDAVAPAFQTFLKWQRDDGYSVRRMSRNVARSTNEAAFGPDGVVSWLKQLCRRIA